jgi:hypothetical protein
MRQKLLTFSLRLATYTIYLPDMETGGLFDALPRIDEDAIKPRS